MSFSKRLIELIEFKGFKNANEFGKYLGYSSSEKISRIVRDEANKPSFDILVDIANKFADVSLDWLLKGEGEIIKQAINADVKAVFNLKTDVSLENQNIPLYDLEAVAGLVPLFYNGKQEPINYIQIPHLPKCDGAVYVTGDSMYPLLKSGDIVLYKAITDFETGLFWGEMYLISIDLDGEEYISVKYVQKSDKDGFIKLVSYNQHHAEKEVKMSKIRALALVKASIRINSMR